jgi:transcriptional regulator NrdR family protein
MHCPVCHHDDSAVIDSKSGRRRRRCTRCGERWSTVEIELEEWQRYQALTKQARALSELLPAPLPEGA